MCSIKLNCSVFKMWLKCLCTSHLLLFPETVFWMRCASNFYLVLLHFSSVPLQKNNQTSYSFRLQMLPIADQGGSKKNIFSSCNNRNNRKMKIKAHVLIRKTNKWIHALICFLPLYIIRHDHFVLKLIFVILQRSNYDTLIPDCKLI